MLQVYSFRDSLGCPLAIRPQGCRENTRCSVGTLGRIPSMSAKDRNSQSVLYGYLFRIALLAREHEQGLSDYSATNKIATFAYEYGDLHI